MEKKLKIQFVGISCEQLSIGLLSAIAKGAGYEVSLVFSPSLFNDKWLLEKPFIAKFLDETRNILSQIEKVKPDVLAFSPLSGTYRWQLYIARKAKEIYPSIKTIFGGVHVSAVPERVVKKPEVDFVVVGEGDLVFLEILKYIEEKLSGNSIPNTLYLNPRGQVVRGRQLPFNQELDSLPFCDKIIWEEHVNMSERYMIMVGRGCPYRCTYCFNSFFANLPGKRAGQYIRFRSVGHVIKELLWAKKRYRKIRFIDFQDDTFTLNKAWLGEFLERYKRQIFLPFQCLVHPNFLDEEIVQWLNAAGCQWIEMGVQSIDDEYKKLHLKRYESSEKVAEAIKLIKKYGIRLVLDHILALPKEPLSAQEKALRFYAENTPTAILVFWPVYFPGTIMLEDSLKEKLITNEEVENLYEGFDFHDFRSDKNIKDPTTKKLYQRYEFIFKLLPFLPSRVRLKINIRSIRWFPSFILAPMVFLSAVMLFWDHPRFIFFRSHYIFHLKRFFYKKLIGKELKVLK